MAKAENRPHVRRAPAYRRVRGRERRAAGPHYNQSTVNGVVPPVVNDQTEVWLDVTVGPGGECGRRGARALRALAR